MKAIVTGATSGIGKEIARGLLRRGFAVGIVGRNPAKTDRTADELRASVPGSDVETYLADLSELGQVRDLAAELHRRDDRIDVFVNNAGINSDTPRNSSDGFNVMLATNYLAPFLLTNLVLDLLEAAAPSRVVMVASEAHRLSDRIDVDHLTDFTPSGFTSGQRLYGRTKLELILFTQELAARVAPKRITVNAMCPGLVATNIGGEGALFTRVATLASRTPVIRRPEQGAALAIRMAYDTAFASKSGEFFSSTPGAGLLPAAPGRRDRALQATLWDRTANLVGLDRS